MLTKDLLRYQIEGGRILPGLLRPTPSTLQLADDLLAFWRQGVGQQRGNLMDAAMPLLQRSRAVVVARGLQKIILERCIFKEPEGVDELRTRALRISALLLRQPATTAEAHRAQVAAQLGLSGEVLGQTLYCDLPEAAVLEEAPLLQARRLIEIYNLALCQGLMLSARELEITIHDRDLGLRRKLLKGLRFRRLLAEVREQADGALKLIISGPASILDQASRYGFQLALFLPILACSRSWQAQARIMVPARFGAPSTTGSLELSQATGLVGDSTLLGYVPQELTQLQDLLAQKFTTWSFQDAPLISMRDGEIVIGDLAIQAEGRLWSIELFHRWHARALQRRLEQLEKGHAEHLVIGIDRALARTTAVEPLLKHPTFLRCGFVFSDLPSARGIAQIIERRVKEIAGTGGG